MIEMKKGEKIRVIARSSDGWITFKKNNFIAQIKIYDEPSEFGIDGGRISKLVITKQSIGWNNPLISYDRGWDKKITKTTSRNAIKFYKTILKNFN